VSPDAGRSTAPADEKPASKTRAVLAPAQLASDHRTAGGRTTLVRADREGKKWDGEGSRGWVAGWHMDRRANYSSWNNLKNNECLLL